MYYNMQSAISTFVVMPSREKPIHQTLQGDYQVVRVNSFFGTSYTRSTIAQCQAIFECLWP